MKLNKQKIRIVATILITITLVSNIISYTNNIFGATILGTNKALGSPILNDNFVAEDWNNWELIVWGIFLSNFTVPFIDDYNSAFNLDVSYGSNGSGVKALEFGSGRDPANSHVIRDLLDYAINQQLNNGLKPIYVSHAELDNYQISRNSGFKGSTEAADINGDVNEDNINENTEENNAEDANNDNVVTQPINTSDIRQATVKDLIFMKSASSGDTWVDYNINNTYRLTPDEYQPILTIKNGKIPEFAIRNQSGTYETILDYTDSYDLSLIPLILTRGAYGDFKSEFGNMLDTIINNPESFRLGLDCFGNICTQVNGSYRVIIPASANKHLTITPSINLLNSLVLNANVKTASKDQLVLSGGQEYENVGRLLFMELESTVGGTPAFSNKTSGLSDGQTIIYFDTDTIVSQIAKSNGDYYGNTNIDMAKVYKDLYEASMNENGSNTYSFKIEPSNIDEDIFDICSSDEAKEAMQSMLSVSTQLSNQFSKPQDAKILTYMKSNSSTQDLELFNTAVVVPVTIGDGRNTGDYNYTTYAPLRFFANWIYERYTTDTNSTIGNINASEVRNIIHGSSDKNIEELMDNIVFNDDGTLTNLFKGFIVNRRDFYNVIDIDRLNSVNRSELTGTSGNSIRYQELYNLLCGNIHSSLTGYELSEYMEQQNWLEGLTQSIQDMYTSGTSEISKLSIFGRSVKMYPTSEVLSSAANMLGVREGTEFGAMASDIYLTYLDWYGIFKNSVSSSFVEAEDTSNLNKEIFDINSDVLNVDIGEITEILSEDQKEQQILDWTYMLLNPAEGREYRSNMIISGISDWIYDNYQKIVYGNASSYYDTGTGVTSKNSTGFLTIQPYSENFLTAWFVNNYSYFATILIGVFFILIIVIGLLNKRTVSWFLVTMLVMVNMLLILPSTGEMVPLVANNLVQNMFTDKMSYWALSETVTNATMENDYVTGNTISTGYLSTLSKTEQSQVIGLVKNLNTLYTDRSLNIRQDISKKVTQLETSTYEDVQQLRSARWMLPMIMRQFTASDGSANYVYVPLADVYDDVSNMYWFFNPLDAKYVNTVTAKQDVGNDGTSITEYNTNSNGPHLAINRKNYFTSYINNYTISNNLDINYKQKSYEINPSNNVHTYSYFLNRTGLMTTSMPEYDIFENYDEWATEWAITLQRDAGASNLKSIEREIENVADRYSRFDRSTIHEFFGYLWMTQNPLHYFYQGIKDSFPTDSSLGYVVGELQGTYIKQLIRDRNNLIETGNEVRKSFMHANETGYIKDLLDLEELFTNVIPYMYGMQLYAEGYKGVGGVFDDTDFMETFKGYENNLKSWIFRSNWVTKLMENTSYNCGTIIRDSEGNEYEISNMILSRCYPQHRPMIFSEAQQKYYGLEDRDLSLIELKCVEINKEIEKQWTLLLNYASLKGMTKEVMIRQMALSSLIEFNKEFSPSGIIGSTYSMYPNGIDLRSITFDSVMKMLMLNVTHDTSYIYGNTMKTLVEDSDIVTSLLLLGTAFICAFIIPLARNFIMAVIFFLGLWAIVWAIFRTTKDKAKVSCGYIMCNFTFLLFTAIYYLLLKTLMAMTEVDEVLTLSQIEINTGNPVWCMVFILAISILYCLSMYKILQLCVRNYRDMGFEVFAGIAEMASSSISNTMESIGNKISGGETESSVRTRKRHSAKDDPIEVKQSSDSTIVIDDINKNSTNKKDLKARENDDLSASYTDGRYMDETIRSDDIDKQIEKGKEIEKSEKGK